MVPAVLLCLLAFVVSPKDAISVRCPRRSKLVIDGMGVCACVHAPLSPPVGRCLTGPPAQWIHTIAYLSSRCFAVNEFLTCAMKNFIGRPRPSFFATCDYPKEKITVAGETFETYGLFGRPGDVAKCRAPQESVYNAFRSFPSGHSSTATSGTLCILLLLFLYLDTHKRIKSHIMRVGRPSRPRSLMLCVTRPRRSRP